MDSLFKPRISNSAAVLVVFLAAYVGAWVTAFVMEGALLAALQATGGVFACVFVFMSIMFIVSLLLKRTDVVDAAWGPAFVVAAVSAWALNPIELTTGWNVQTLITGLVVIWAMRLSMTIGLRLRKKPEDKRYVDLRRAWKGNPVVNTYIRIFVVQALLATLISAAIVHTNFSPSTEIGGFALAGLFIWIVGFVFEAVGDLQLKRHLARPANKGKLLTTGLWRYTRHPNYFGEATMWWGMFIIALETPFGWLGILTPVLITYLLVFVSGVPMTEKAFEGRPGWNAYKKRTSVFVPLPPRS